jgi:hypothetical protein
MWVGILPTGHFRLVPRSSLTPGEVQKGIKIFIYLDSLSQARRHFANWSLPVDHVTVQNGKSMTGKTVISNGS